MQSTTKAQQKQFKFGQRQLSWGRGRGGKQQPESSSEPEPELAKSVTDREREREREQASKTHFVQTFFSSHNFLICLSATAKEKCCLLLGAHIAIQSD